MQTQASKGQVRLKLGRQGMDVDPRSGEPRQYLFAVAAVRRHGRLDNPVFGKRVQRALRNGVHSEWGSQGRLFELVQRRAR